MYVLIFSIESILICYYGYREVNNRTNFKIIEEQMVLTKENSQYCFDSKKLNSKVVYYPIIFENDDVYIVTRLEKNDNGIFLNYHYQMIIEKEKVETIYYEDYRKLD